MGIRKSFITRAPLLLGLLFIVLISKQLVLVGVFGVDVFFYDQWDFLSPLFADQSLLTHFLHQHGPHRQGVGQLISVAILHLTQWSNIALGYASVILFSVAGILALLIKWQITKTVSLQDGVLLVIFCTAGAWETHYLTPNLSHGVFPILLWLGTIACFSISSTAIRTGCIGLLTLVNIFTGFGVFSGVVIVAYFLLEIAGRINAGRKNNPQLAQDFLPAKLSLGLVIAVCVG